MTASHGPLISAPVVESVILTLAAGTGSLVATITTNHAAALTTLVATVGTLLYQILRVIMEHRRRAILADAGAQITRLEAALEAEREINSVLARQREIVEALQRDKDRLQRILLVMAEGTPPLVAVEVAEAVAGEETP